MAKCDSCKDWNVGRGASYGDVKMARDLHLCVPCAVEGSWENVHSDYGHDPDGPEYVDTLTSSEAGHSVKLCWACHPELNPRYVAEAATEVAATEPEPRQGSSRAGVVHSVRRRDTGRDKAKTVAAHVKEGVTVRSYRKGTISCRIVAPAGTVRLDWDAEGHFLNTSKIERDGASRKVRNVSEAYRLLAIAK